MNIPFRQNQIHLFLIFFIWLCCAIFVDPIGEFPLNDDWAYAKNVFHLSENGDLVFDDWPAMTLIVHMLWGAMFTSIFGFSFTVLRISVLILGLAGIWGFYLVIIKISRNHILALIGSLTLAFNPLYFSLSNTFMTDVSFLALIIWSLYFYLSYIEKPQFKNLFLAILFVVLATLIRQLGIWIAISFVITNFLFFKTERRRIFNILALSFFPLIVLVVFPYWLRIVDSIPSNFSSIDDLFRQDIFAWILKNIFHRSGILLFNIGLFSLPVSLAVFSLVWEKMKKSHRFIAAIIAVLALYPLILNLKHVPAGNVFFNLGLGPKILKDTYWGLNLRPEFWDGFLWFFYGMGILGSMLLIFVGYYVLLGIFSDNQAHIERKSKIFLLVIFSGFMGFIFMGTYFFDRYFLTVLPFVLLFLIPANLISNQKTTIFGFLMPLPFLFFSAMATKDYLSWNKARWKGINELLESGVAPSKIDGGFEFNAWYETGEMRFAQPGLKSWWFVDDDDYALAFGQICGYEILKSYDYFSFLSFQNDSIVVLKKAEIIDSVQVHCGAEYVNNSGDSFLGSDSSVLFSNAESRTDMVSLSGNYSVQLNKMNPEGFETSFNNISLCEEWSVSVWCMNPQLKTRLVVICPDNESFYWVSKFDGEEKNGWVSAEINFIVPDQFPSNSLKIYLWNPDDESAYFDDLKITRYLR